MSDDSLARNLPDAPGSVDADYAAIHAAIVETERGRWFLDEYARRHRGADTDLVLAAIGELEAAVREDREGRPAPPMIEEIAALVAAIRQARSELVGRHGDPAASGEAAIAEFRHAAEAVRDLALPHVAGTDLSAQLSFQINRLAIAGDRLERSVGGLRTLLGLLDDIEQGLRDLAQGPLPETDAAPAPAAPPLPARTVAPAAAWWPVPAAVPAPEPPPQPAPATRAMPVADRAPAAPAPEFAPAAGALADLTIGRPDPAPHPGASAGPAMAEDLVADWAFTPASVGPSSEFDAEEPPPEATLTEPEPAEAPVSALERIEAREYGRQRLVTAVAPPVDETEPADADHAPEAGGLDDLVLGGAPLTAEPPSADTAGPESEPSDWVARPEPGPSEWAAGPDPTEATAEPLFDTDLFDAETAPAAAAAQPPLLDEPGDAPAAEDDAPEAMPAEPAPFVQEMMKQLEPAPTQMAAPAPTHNGLLDFPTPLSPAAPDDLTARPEEALSGIEPPAEGPPPPAGEPGRDTPSVLQRLEDMRTAIASLMNEVSERKAGRRPPPQAS